jgi:hypothetical protein
MLFLSPAELSPLNPASGKRFNFNVEEANWARSGNNLLLSAVFWVDHPPACPRASIKQPIFRVVALDRCRCAWAVYDSLSNSLDTGVMK